MSWLGRLGLLWLGHLWRSRCGLWDPYDKCSKNMLSLLWKPLALRGHEIAVTCEST
jgi:hypothetical protein